MMMARQITREGLSGDEADETLVPERVLICDDHPVFRMGLVAALSADDSIEVLGEASTAQECIDSLTSLQPDILLLDLALPDRDGYSVLQWIKDGGLMVRVLVLSMYVEWAFAERARSLGALAFIAKEDALSELQEAIKTPHGAFYASSSVVAPDDDELGIFIPGLSERSGRLSPTERSVMQLLGQGLTSREIGERLGMSPRTVQTHRNHCADKLGVRGVNRLMELAIRYRALFS